MSESDAEAAPEAPVEAVLFAVRDAEVEPGHEHLDELMADDEDSGAECGRWDNGRLLPWQDCRKAGSEECEWECPHGR